MTVGIAIAAVVVALLLASFVRSSVKSSRMARRDGLTLPQFVEECKAGMRCPECLERLAGCACGKRTANG